MPPRPILRPGLLSRAGGCASPRPLTLALRPAALSCSARTYSAAAPPPSSPPPPSSSNPAVADANGTGDTPDLPKLPPQSPHYIRIPTPLQSEEPRHPPRRGHLPVPRDVFHLHQSLLATGKAKVSSTDRRTQPAVSKGDAAAWAAAAAPLSEAARRGEAPRTPREAARRRLAEGRRRNLEAGLAGLWTRHEQRTREARARAEGVARRHRRAALETPERADEVLTRSSVRAATALNTAVVRDPERQARQAEAAARTQAVAQAKRDARRDALMELYQAAGKFIVDEAELERRVEELFRPDYFKDEGYAYGTINAENVWDVIGKPSTVQDMMSGITRTETKLYDSKRTEADRTTKRQKLVAEALTGGKMPV